MQIKTLKEAEEYLTGIAEELQSLAAMDRMEMYRMLTQFGDDIPALVDGERSSENFVLGCISNVYIGHTIEDGHIEFRGHSESMVVRGYLSILIHALSGLSTGGLLQGSQILVERFCEQTDVRAQLTPSRANAFGNIYRLMRKKAGEQEGAEKKFL